MPNARVLLVDQDEEVLQRVSETLTREGLRIVTASVPSHVLGYSRQTLSFDVVEIELGDGAVCRMQPETIRHFLPVRG